MIGCCKTVSAVVTAPLTTATIQYTVSAMRGLLKYAISKCSDASQHWSESLHRAAELSILLSLCCVYLAASLFCQGCMVLLGGDPLLELGHQHEFKDTDCYWMAVLRVTGLMIKLRKILSSVDHILLFMSMVSVRTDNASLPQFHDCANRSTLYRSRDCVGTMFIQWCCTYHRVHREVVLTSTSTATHVLG